jgi:hypothetical protein
MCSCRIRDLNDEINKLIREKGHWERRIVELGGPDYAKTAPKLTDTEGHEMDTGRGGYRWVPSPPMQRHAQLQSPHAMWLRPTHAQEEHEHQRPCHGTPCAHHCSCHPRLKPHQRSAHPAAATATAANLFLRPLLLHLGTLVLPSSCRA